MAKFSLHEKSALATAQKKSPAQHLIQSLEQQFAHREHEISLLIKTNDVFSTQLHLEYLLQQISLYAQQLVAAETMIIPILDSNCATYTYRYGSGENAKQMIGQCLPMDVGICGWVWSNQYAWWRGNLDALDDYEKTVWEQSADQVVMAPLIGKQYFFGSLCGINKKGGGEFSEQDMELLTLFAGDISNALEIALMEHNLEELNKKVEKLINSVPRQIWHDALTGLPNRFLMQQHINHNIGSATNDHESLVVMVMEIQGFANDELQAITRHVQSVLRETDIIGRVKGGKFIVLLPATDAEDIAFVAEKLNATLYNLADDHIRHKRLSAVFGIAHYPAHGNDDSTLLRLAESALTRAKRSQQPYVIATTQESETAVAI